METKDKMIEYGIEFASKLLRDFGEFHPFGAAIDKNEKIVAIGGWNGEEYPNPKDLLKLLSDSLVGSMRKGEYKMGLIVYNGYTMKDGIKTDAINMYIIYPNETCDKVEIPYTATRT